jgi:hypothetical protein
VADEPQKSIKKPLWIDVHSRFVFRSSSWARSLLLAEFACEACLLISSQFLDLFPTNKEIESNTYSSVWGSPQSLETNRFVDFAASAARIMPISGGVGPFVPMVEMTVCTLCFSKSWVSSSTS